MSLGSTFWDQAAGGVVESFGLGTAIRSLSTPPRASARRGRETEEQYQARQATRMTEEAYKSSPYYRQSVPWDDGMTEDRAAALATQWDTKAVRGFYAEKRPITSFFGNLAGQAIDPINYIPVTGPAVRAAAIAKMGTVKGIAANAALDASLNTAIAGLATRETRAAFGDDVSWQAMVSEIATAALIGGAFGTVGGVLERRAGTRAATVRQETEQRLSTLRTVQESRVALNEAIGGLANEGEIRLSPNATEPMARIQQEIAVNKDAPPADETAYLSARELRREYSSQYEVDGQKIASSRTTPSVQQIPPVGAWRIDDVKGLYGREVEQLRQVAVDDLVLPELRDGELDVTKRGDDATYAQWIKEGKEPPPVELIRMEDGRLRVADGHRRVLAAKAAGATEVKGWVSELVETGKMDSSGRPMKASLTFELAQQKTPNPVSPKVDASPARPDPIPEGRIEAEARTAKPDDYKALASQYRVDPETGKFDEEAELRQLETEGRLTEEDAADMEAADETYQDSASYGEALKAAVGCLL